MAKLTTLTSRYLNSKNIVSGYIAYTPNIASITGVINLPAEPSKPRVTNCKNCGAPLHGNHCEYCGTEY